jgi:pyridoxamine 5'-phosphate oxidase
VSGAQPQGPAEHSRPLVRADLTPDPYAQFARWFAEAGAVVRMPEAMALATATAAGRPSVRMVLMKSFDERGFVFHTNYASRKGVEVADNAFVAAVFYWDPLGRQVRIEGPVERVGDAESDAYFAARPRGAQIGAHASRQSQPVASRSDLDARVGELDRRFAGREVPRPPWWGGLRIRPVAVEFWQNRDDRLHDRFRYSAAAGAPGAAAPGAAAPGAGAGEPWDIRRLQP